MEHHIRDNKMRDNNTLISGNIYNIINNEIKYYESSDTSKKYQSSFIIKKINKLKKYFVEISQYKKAVNELGNSNAVMFIGCSGIGKTDTSIMAANYFIENYGYKFRFIESPNENDIQKIFALIDQNIEEKEVLIFDDFLGNIKLNKSESYFYELEKILKNIEYCDEKKFIFNTRKTIFQDAKVYSKKVYNLVNQNCKIIDLEYWENIQDKVEVFRKYCKKNNIFDKILKLINEKKWNKKICEDIINHQNFTPLIIKTAAKECCNVDVLEYQSIFFRYLNHPEEIWEKEYKALDEFSQKYLKILYSLSDNFIEQDIVDECYKNYINKQNIAIDNSLNEIHEHIDSLVYYDNNQIQFIHPSLIEYLENKISISDENDIINTAIYLEQVVKLDDKKVEELLTIKEGSYLPSIFNFKVLAVTYKLDDGKPIKFTNNILLQYLKYLYEFNIDDEEHQEIVTEVLKSVLEYGASLFFHCSDIVLNVLKLNYDFSEILNNDKFIMELYEQSNPDSIWILIELTIQKDEKGIDFKKLDDFIQEKIESALIDIGTNVKDSWIQDNIENYIEDEFEYYNKDDEYDYSDITQGVLDNMSENFDIELAKDAIRKTIEKYCLYNIDIDSLDDFEISDYIWEITNDAIIEFDNNREC
ncbi:MAG: hypothetical protein K0R54_5658 [Clostridiaceae bacterium]|jgi:hypothetical protein|nr:hypothetical protein [Clostridiaceae bacterium]